MSKFIYRFTDGRNIKPPVVLEHRELGIWYLCLEDRAISLSTSFNGDWQLMEPMPETLNEIVFHDEMIKCSCVVEFQNDWYNNIVVDEDLCSIVSEMLLQF